METLSEDLISSASHRLSAFGFAWLGKDPEIRTTLRWDVGRNGTGFDRGNQVLWEEVEAEDVCLSVEPVHSVCAFSRIQLDPQLFSGSVFGSFITLSFEVSEQPSAVMVDQSASWPAT